MSIILDSEVDQINYHPKSSMEGNSDDSDFIIATKELPKKHNEKKVSVSDAANKYRENREQIRINSQKQKTDKD